jgi:hypothetical protein
VEDVSEKFNKKQLDEETLNKAREVVKDTLEK